MRCAKLVSAIALCGLGLPGVGATQPLKNYRLEGGLWWDGARFAPATMFSVEGTFSRTAPARVDSVIRLGGAFVVPPFAEAHTHTIAYVRPRVDQFLRAGVFYALVMNVDRTAIARNAAWFNRPRSVDVAWTVAAATEANAHPIQIGMQNGRSVAQLDGDWVTVIESAQELDTKWPALRDANTDFIKLFLLDSERYAAIRRDSTVPPRWRGMNPDLVAPLVERAHAAGLRVAAHVRSAHDFKVAVDAGVDIVAHLPGFSMGPFTADALDDPARRAEAAAPDRFRIRPEDARRAAALGTTVITTIGGLGTVPAGLEAARASALDAALATRRAVLSHNLSVLRDAGVRIAIGSDAGEGSPVTEALAVHALGVFTPAELLRMLTEHAARVTFPRRSVGRLTEGYEASFLVLAASPLQDVGAIRDVRFRFKQGQPLMVP